MAQVIPMPVLTARYQVVESTDLMTGVKSFRVYRRNALGPTVSKDFKTREEAVRKMAELEGQA